MSSITRRVLCATTGAHECEHSPGGHARPITEDRWQARYYDPTGKQVTRRFDRKVDAQQWLDAATAAVHTGTYLNPATARTTVAAWCATWLVGYGTRRASTVAQARVHIALIVAEFGPLRLDAVRPSLVRSWTAGLRERGYAPSTVYAVHRRLAQIMGDAVHDGLLARNPCSRRTSPGAPRQRPYVATTAQVWALHDAFPEHLRPAVLLGAFVGLRTAEVAGLRLSHVDFMRGVVHPTEQYPGQELKTETARTPLPIPPDLALTLSASVRCWGGQHAVTDGMGGQVTPWQIDRAVRAARAGVPGLPEAFRFHDLRHYLASLLIASGLDVKVVQHRLRHANATTTLNTYAHLWPDSDESARAAVGAVLAARADSLRAGDQTG